MKKRFLSLAVALSAALSAGAAAEPAKLEINGTLENRKIDEASGLQAGNGGVFYTHNDQKRDLFVIDEKGRHLGEFKLDDAKNRDWEDLTRVPGVNGPLLVVADTGDNQAKRKDVDLYFFPEPEAGEFNQEHAALHRLQLSYPDGPRDVEAVAFDPASETILFLSKRDALPRLYGIPLDRALREEEVVADFLAEVPGFRPPTKMDILSNPKRGMWVSQPTGMDISPDGQTAAVITYRSLYLFRRDEGESWAEAFQRQPREIEGPPGTHEEAVAFSLDGKTVFVTTERRPAPIYRLDHL